MSTLETSLDPYEIWFFTGSQNLYGEETLRQVAEQSQTIADTLHASAGIPVKIVWKPVLKDSESIRRAALDVNADDRVIGVIAWMHTFSPAKMWIAGLGALQKPLLHFHTQANVELPYADIDFDFMNLNQAAHGDREFGYIQTRLGVARKTVVGHASSTIVQSQIADWSRAAAGWQAVKTLKLARFGDNMRYVAVTEGDKTEAEIRFGVQVNTWGVNDLADAVAAVPDDRIDALVAEYEELYDVAPELRSGASRHQSLRDGAAIELGLRSFLEEGGFGAFTTSFEDLGALKQLPGLAVQRLMADGYGFGAEGDWKTAILVRAANVMGAGLPGGASLMEDYTYDLVEGQETILGAHMLEVSPSLTSAKPTLEIHPLGIGGKDDPVRLVFTADPGPAVVVAMSDMRDRFRLVANVVEVVEPRAPLPNLPVGRAVWRPEPSFAVSAAAWLTAGAAHHTVMSTAVGIEVFEDFAA
ncbi:MAG: L-arabinose isomerase, partial [Subtercola sp.]|nr:L-arabinose isomerase [Subtercola sp.]